MIDQNGGIVAADRVASAKKGTAALAAMPFR
jgi:hypothetical protein